MKKTLSILISLIFQNIVYSQVIIERVTALNSNKLIKINARIDTLENNEINTFEIINVTAKNNEGQTIESSEAYPDMYYHHGLTQFIFKSKSNPIYKLDSLKIKLKYFTPTVETKSILTINNPLEKLNLSLIENEYPDIKFIILDFYTLKHLKRKNKRKYEALIEKIEEKNTTQKGFIALLMDKVFNDYKKLPNSELKKRLLIYMEDKKSQIIKTSMYDDNLVSMSSGAANYFSNPYTTLIQVMRFEVIPQNNWTLKLFIENEKSTKEVVLKMKNIIVPKDKIITNY